MTKGKPPHIIKPKGEVNCWTHWISSRKRPRKHKTVTRMGSFAQKPSPWSCADWEVVSSWVVIAKGPSKRSTHPSDQRHHIRLVRKFSNLISENQVQAIWNNSRTLALSLFVKEKLMEGSEKKVYIGNGEQRQGCDVGNGRTNDT